jgi:two-component system, chemotaxis family, protein-glutamate methylesterase/glutaminase
MRNKDITTDPVELDAISLESIEMPGSPSVIICPECGGVMWERRLGNFGKLQCHLGHAFDMASLLEFQAEEIEQRLWSLLRVLRERVSIIRQLAASARENNNHSEAQQIESQAQQSLQRAQMIRQVILLGETRATSSGLAIDEVSNEN